MTRRHPENLTASVKQRLLNLARARHEEFRLVLSRYANERFLARLAASEYSHRFVVKGAVLFLVWTNEPHRATQDLDLLGFGAPTENVLAHAVQEVCNIAVEEDGLLFDTASVKVEPIRENQEYGGLRVKLVAHLGGARIPIQIDVGFGDAVEPEPKLAKFPTLLSMTPPELLVYSKESVVAEKLHAMVSLGMANSRMKDFFDIWLLSQSFVFEGDELAGAIRATFGRRATPLPRAVPLALTTAFSSDHQKQTQWRAFLGRTRPRLLPPELREVIAILQGFLAPVLSAAVTGEPFTKQWPPRGSWRR